MSTQRNNSIFKNFNLLFQPLLDQRFMIQFLLKWTLIGLIVGSCIGCASAVFLYSLNWVTDFREANLWIVAFLPLCGFLIGSGCRSRTQSGARLRLH